jgi:hypothetical protein
MEEKSDPSFEAGVKRSIRNLEELRFQNPEKFRKEVLLRYLDRKMATQWEPYPEHQRLLEQWRAARDTAWES